VSGNTVWLASYPKSGNTWFRTVVAAWQHADPFALESAGPISSDRGRFDQLLGVASSDLTAGEVRALRPIADAVFDSAFDRPHLRKIHDSLFSGPEGTPIVSLTATRGAVYLVRDPRDVAVSFAHHGDRTVDVTVQRMGAAPKAMVAAENDITPQIPQYLGRWSDHVVGWVDRAPFPVHVLRYEDCLADPAAAFGSALAFAGFDLTRAQLQGAIELASFARLQEREQAEGFRERWGRGSAFFRRGVAGGWRDELDAELVARVESEHREAMVRFGYLDSGAAPETASSTAESATSA
jgi:aryl sulfotransferase